MPNNRLVIAKKPSLTELELEEKERKRQQLAEAKRAMLAARKAFREFKLVDHSPESHAEQKRLFAVLEDAVDEFLCLSLPDAIEKAARDVKRRMPQA